MEETKKKPYQLIAFDMDGTLLNSEKKITEKTLKAIHDAAEAGKYIALNTGRSPAELGDYLEILPDVHYLNCISGALVRDIPKDKTIYQAVLEPELVMRLMDIASLEDCMMHIHSVRSVVQRDRIPQMARYHMGIYQGMFERVTSPMTDLRAEYREDPFPAAKFNIYHTDVEARERSYHRILEAGLEVQMAYAEETSLEISPKGVHKGIGLIRLCEYLGIGIDQTIAVGDADNDLLALQTAGLAIAMGNANENVRKVSQVMVADNDHDGCAEAIYRYLMGK